MSKELCKSFISSSLKWYIWPSGLPPTTVASQAFLWAFHLTSTATNSQFSRPRFPEVASEDKKSSLKSENWPTLWWGILSQSRKDVTDHNSHGKKNKEQQWASPGPQCETSSALFKKIKIKKHYKRLRIEATHGQAGHRPNSNKKSPRKKNKKCWQLGWDMKLKYFWGKIVKPTKRDKTSVNVVANCHL